MIEGRKYERSLTKLPFQKRLKEVHRRDGVGSGMMESQKSCERKVAKKIKVEDCWASVDNESLKSTPTFGRHIKREEDCLASTENKHLVNTLKFEKNVKNEEDDGNSSDVEILEMDNALFHNEGNFGPFVVSKVLNATVKDDDLSPNKNESPFRKKLMEILRRSYNQQEYENLLQKVTNRHLKGCPEYSKGVKKANPQDTYGKSPLDYHPVVKRKLNAVQDDRLKSLNLLRGFMYWYEKACQDGAFEPWLDKSCLAVTSRPC